MPLPFVLSDYKAAALKPSFDDAPFPPLSSARLTSHIPQFNVAIKDTTQREQLRFTRTSKIIRDWSREAKRSRWRRLRRTLAHQRLQRFLETYSAIRHSMYWASLTYPPPCNFATTIIQDFWKRLVIMYWSMAVGSCMGISLDKTGACTTWQKPVGPRNVDCPREVDGVGNAYSRCCQKWVDGNWDSWGFVAELVSVPSLLLPSWILCIS